MKVGVTGSDQLARSLARINLSADVAQIGRTYPVSQGSSSQLPMIDDGVARAEMTIGVIE